MTKGEKHWLTHYASKSFNLLTRPWCLWPLHWVPQACQIPLPGRSENSAQTPTRLIEQSDRQLSHVWHWMAMYLGKRIRWNSCQSPMTVAASILQWTKTKWFWLAAKLNSKSPEDDNPANNKTGTCNEDAWLIEGTMSQMIQLNVGHRDYQINHWSTRMQSSALFYLIQAS